MPAQDKDDVETMLLGPVLPDRACGGCTACCTAMTVDSPDFKKPGGVPCIHLDGDGCGIHPVRPTICRTWFCAWRRVAAMPDYARPDRAGLLVSLTFNRAPRNCFDGVAITVQALPGRTLDRSVTAAVLDSLCDGLVPVWFSDGSRKMLMHPDAEVAGLVLSGAVAPAPLREDVAAWREQYGMFAAGD